jgi:ABC-type sugar transport system substrate-binding protein
MKRILVLTLALVLALSLTATAAAEGKKIGYSTKTITNDAFQ